MIPDPIHLKAIAPEYANRWVYVTEAIPPRRFCVLVIVRGDNTPAYAWLKYAAGDRTCPYFVCPQLAAMEPRGVAAGKPAHARGRDDIVAWWSPGVELPIAPRGFEDVDWGISGMGWYRCERD